MVKRRCRTGRHIVDHAGRLARKHRPHAATPAVAHGALATISVTFHDATETGPKSSSCQQVGRPRYVPPAHPAELKLHIVQACQSGSVLIAAGALASCLNANIVRKRVIDAEVTHRGLETTSPGLRCRTHTHINALRPDSKRKPHSEVQHVRPSARGREYAPLVPQPSKAKEAPIGASFELP